MKNRFFFCAVFSIAFFLSACKSSTSPNGGGGLNTPVMTATVNGRYWGGIIPITGNRSGYQDFFAGDSNSSIEMYYTQTDTGTFPVNGNTGDDLFMTYDSTGKAGYDKMCVSYANSGTVHFTINTNTRAVGTFNFKAINQNSPYDTIVITNGTFDIAR